MNQLRTPEDLQINPNQVTIQTELESNAQTAVIRIQDNGPGMPEITRQQIFNYLFTTKTAGQGTGLGLSISHQIVVDKHGGEIICDSTPGAGTEFMIKIPV